MGRHFFLNGQVGQGVSSVKGQGLGVQAAAGKQMQLLYGGSLGYRTYAHTVLVTYGKSLNDAYGIAVGSAFTTREAAWTWNRPGRAWGLQTSFVKTQLNALATSVQGGHVDSWFASGGFSRRLGPRLSLSAGYMIGKLGSKSLVQDKKGYQLSESGVQVSLTWSPRIQLLR